VGSMKRSSGCKGGEKWLSWFNDEGFENDVLRLLRRLNRRFSLDRGSLFGGDLDRLLDGTFGGRDFEGFDKELLEPPKGEGWTVRKIDKPGMKGYIAERRIVIRGDDEKRFSDGWRPRVFGGRQRLEDVPGEVPEAERSRSMEPLVDVREDLDRVQLYVLLPGVRHDDVKVNVSKDAVEIVAGDYRRSISLPSNVIPEKAAKEFHGNTLTVVVPKSHDTNESSDDRKPSPEDIAGTI